MLKKLLTGGLAACTMAVPLAAVASADPSPTPNPPAMPNVNSQNPTNPNPGAVPGANGPGPVSPAAPAAAGPNGQTPTCVVSANTPAQGPPGTTWRQVATLQGSVASGLGLPPGQTMNVFCAPVGAPNLAEQPVGSANPGQATPAPNPVQNQPGQTGPQNPPPGQH